VHARLYHAVQFLLVDYNTKVTQVLDPDTYRIHQIFIPFGDTPAAWEKCSQSWDAFKVTRWNKEICISVITQAMPNRRELLNYEGVMFTDVCSVAIMYVHGGLYVNMDICAKMGLCYTFLECEVCLFLQNLCRNQQRSHDCKGKTSRISQHLAAVRGLCLEDQLVLSALRSRNALYRSGAVYDSSAGVPRHACDLSDPRTLLPHSLRSQLYFLSRSPVLMT